MWTVGDMEIKGGTTGEVDGELEKDTTEGMGMVKVHMQERKYPKKTR